MMRAIIIDDEHLSRYGIQLAAQEYCSDVVETVGEANGVESGIEEIKKKRPDLVFLDIRMGDGTGFDLLTNFPDRDFEVIFVTAYPEFEADAHQLGLVDYLIKPINVDTFTHAVKKAQKRYENKRIKLALKQSTKTQLIIPDGKVYRFIPIKDVLWCETVNGQRKTTLVLKNSKSIVANALLKVFDNKLAYHSFIRVHASFLINANYIEVYQPVGSAGIIQMRHYPEINIPVSRGHRDSFINFLKGYDSDFIL